MSVWRAWRDGMRRVNRAPALLIGVWALTFVTSLPLALTMRGILRADLGDSLAADSAAASVNYEWMQELASHSSGWAGTFKPTIIGFGAVLDSFSGFADQVHQPAAIAAAAALYMGAWLFLAGGIIDRFARDRATRTHAFFSASGVFFFRFVRLAVAMGAVYGLVFRVLHPWLFDSVYPRWTRELAVERTAFAIRIGLYVAFGFVLAACNLLFDYAKVRMVVEDRRSMIGATLAGTRFIRRNLAAAAGLYAADLLLFAIVLAVYAVVAPGAGQSGWSMWLGFFIGQGYLLARLWIKLVFWASETALFQDRLAHAGYVAAAAPIWPEAANEAALSTRDRS